DAQRRGLAAAARADQRDDLAVAHAEAEIFQRAHRLLRTIDAQHKSFRDIDEFYRAHRQSPLIPAQAGIQGQELGPRFRGDERRKERAQLHEVDLYFASSSAFARTSGATIFFRSTGFGMLPFLMSISCIQASFSIGKLTS